MTSSLIFFYCELFLEIDLYDKVCLECPVPLLQYVFIQSDLKD